MEVVPVSVMRFLDEWEVRVFVILSLVLQILLIVLGNRRKYVCKLWIRIITWCAYLLGDRVAMVSLGIIAKNTLDRCTNKVKDDDELIWLWAQFFILHLGGPDTITAYSLEDNELWLRYLLNMVIQTGLALYVLLVAFPGSYWLPSLSLLIFIAGMIKYGERLSTLWAADSENFRDSLLPCPDPGPNYPRFMEEYTLKKGEGFDVDVAEVKDDHAVALLASPNESCGVSEAYRLFLTFKRLFADTILSFHERDDSELYFRNLSGEEAFGVVEIELGFMFDEIYTKAAIVYNGRGCVFRVVTFSCTLFAWIAFFLWCDKNRYKDLDLAITHLLFVVALCLEVYAVYVLIHSDWTRSRLTGGGGVARMIQRLQKPNPKRWSKKMAQHNLLDLCVRDKSGVCPRSRRFLWRMRRLTKIDNYVEKHWHKSFVDVSPELKELVLRELNSYKSESDPASMWNRKGSFTLKKYKSLSRSLDWIEKWEFDQKILLWHIATEICYSLEWGDTDSSGGNERRQMSEHSKHISDYMMYLLIACPFMLPIGIGMIRFRDTCAEAREFLRERHAISSKVEACAKLLEVNTEVPPRKVKGDRSKSVLFDACILAKALTQKKEDKDRIWDITSRVWVEMLAHAATRCSGNHHASQLRKGGELLSHVWLLMAHLGITDQFQISQGHARPKLIVK